VFLIAFLVSRWLWRQVLWQKSPRAWWRATIRAAAQRHGMQLTMLCNVKAPSGPVCVHPRPQPTALPGLRACPRRGESRMHALNNLPLMKSLPEYVSRLIKQRIGAVLKK